MSTCVVGSDEGPPSEVTDHSTLNRATYDRIARRYAEHQRQLEMGDDSAFSILEEVFHARLRRDGLVADVGCGPGIDACRLEERGLRVVGLDLSRGMLDVAADELSGQLIQADMRSLPLVAGAFDGIWCVASLLHVPERDTMSVLRGFKRALGSFGVLALATALGQHEQCESVEYAQGEQRWYVYRDRRVLREQLLSAGFSVMFDSEVRGNRQWATFLAQTS